MFAILDASRIDQDDLNLCIGLVMMLVRVAMAKLRCYQMIAGNGVNLTLLT